MILSIIVAVAENNVIGKDNKLIWHLPADMKFFKEKTSGHAVITGRKNYESIPEKFRPLPNRTNIIITRQKDYVAPGAVVTCSLDEAIQYAKTLNDKEVFIIGGAEIFKQSIDKVDIIYRTIVHQSFEGDTFFPSFDESNWILSEKKSVLPDERNKFALTFETLIRKK